MLKVYYTVEKDTRDFDGVEECTGNRTVTAYTVEGGEVKKFFDVETTNEDNSEEALKEWLDDNGYEEKDIQLVIL